MTHNRSRAIVVSIAFAGALALTGCAASDGLPAAESTPIESESSAITDADTCAAMGDVITIAANADVGVRERRMSAQEQQGWYQLATRVLALVPTRGEGEVSAAVAGLQTAVPPATAGARVWQPESVQFDDAYLAVAEACKAAGSEISTLMFTGG